MRNFNLIVVLTILCLNAYAQTVDITFRVNMSYQDDIGVFNPNSDFVDIAGTFNDWGGTPTQLDNTDNDEYWEVTQSFTAGESIEFKFRINGQWDGTEEFPGGGPNRSLTIPSSATTYTYWYGDEEPPSGPPVAAFKASSNVALTNGNVSFYNRSEGLVTSYYWIFEGGTPATARSRDVDVTYADPGVYDVTLVASHGDLSDTLHLPDYIEIIEQNDELNWWNEAIFYEIFVRSFYDSDGDGIGDFQGIIEKLDYLNDGNPETTADLGITGIWLMPINESPSYHGYDVTDYKSVASDYGTMDDFKELVKKAHERGIKIIIDLVLNHSSTQHPWFQDASSSVNSDKRDYYRWTDNYPGYNGPWGQTVWHGSSTGYYYGLFWGGMPDLNYENEALKAEVMDITRYWVEEIGIDGYRLDAVKYIYEEGSELEDLVSTHQFWEEFNAEMKDANPDAFSVGEAWTSTEKVVPYVVNDRLDICFDFDLSYNMIGAVNDRNVSGLRTQIEKLLSAYPKYQYGTFITNHDITRIMDQINEDEDKMKVLAGMYLTLPGVPFIYYGEEVGMTGEKPDENIRRPMSWDASEEAGFTTGRPWNDPANNSSTNNVEGQSTDYNSLLSWYRRLIHLRNENQTLSIGELELLDSGNSGLIIYKRVYEGKQLVVAINTGTSEVSYSLAESVFDFQGGNEEFVVDLLSSTALDYQIEAGEVNLSIGSQDVQIMDVTNVRPSAVISDAQVTLYPNPTKGSIQIQSDELINAVEVIDIKGAIVQQLNVQGLNASIAMDALNKGLYIIKVFTSSGIQTRSVIKE